MINRNIIDKEINVQELINRINNKEHAFENISIDKIKNLCDIKNQVFENLIFKNCIFKYLNIAGCRIINCQFIDCRFFDTALCDNVIKDTKVLGVQFSNNSYIERNIFDAVVGNLDEKQHYISSINNYFKNMDFSGFLPAYTNTNFSDCDI